MQELTALRRWVAGAALAALVVVAGPGAVGAATAVVTAKVATNVIAFGQGTVVTGSTTPARPGGKVAVERRLDGARWSTRAVGYADGTGAFRVPIKPTASGIYALRVRTTVGYSPVFYLRVLPPVVLDPGGLHALRLGMTVDQALATHWVVRLQHQTCTSGLLNWGYGPAGTGIAVLFWPGDSVKQITVGAGGRTIEGLRVGDPLATVARVYPKPTFTIVDDGPQPGGFHRYWVSRGGKAVYSVSVGSGGHVATITVPFDLECR